MDNLNNQNSNSINSNSEVSMSNENQIIELFQSFLSNGGAPKVTSFKKHLDQLINSNIKPLCVRSGKTAEGNDWRSELKTQFGGRGLKWVFIELSEIESTLIKFETAGIDCTDYRQFTKDHGKAWIRFAGGRINDNLKSAAFQVRINGSKLDHTKQLHYIPMDNLDIIEKMIGTPNSLKLELNQAEVVVESVNEEVAPDPVVTETAVKPEAKAIDPFRIMPDVKETATAEVQKSIADKDVDVTEVTYKELKDIAPYQTVADFFNIPVSRIKNPKDNLRKSDDVANIQRWILKNEPTLKNLFTEANRDVIEVTEGNRVIRQGGEPTAIPRNLLNKFYTKGDRVGNNFQWKLKPYDRTTFLEAVGIRDGKVDPDFTPRAAEAQTIKGILDMYTRNLGNVAARDIIEGREDIAPAEKTRLKAEIAKGKPRIMMAKEYEQKTTETFDNVLMKSKTFLTEQKKNMLEKTKFGRK